MLDTSGLKQGCLRSGDNRRVIVLQEGAAKYIANNPGRSTVQHFKVDGCLITDGKRCDDMIVLPEDDSCYLIELKGNHLDHAIVQINTSLDTFTKTFRKARFFGRIVVSRGTTDIRSSSHRKLMERFRNLHGDLLVKSKVLEENI